MRKVFLAAVLASGLAMIAGAADSSKVTPAIESMVHAVVTRPGPGKDEPTRPPVSDRVKAGIAEELWNHPTLQASYQSLAANLGNHEWFRSVEELEEAGAVWCLASGLCHPSDDVQIKCAEALTRLANPAPARWVLEVADAFAVPKPGSENATLHALFQHALADALNTLTGAKVKLRDGQDPEGLRAAIPKWKRALRERSGPITRSEEARKRIQAVKADLQSFTLRVSVSPMPEGQWDPDYELDAITLSVTPMERAPTRMNPAGRPADAYAVLSPAQAAILIDALADDGFFDDAEPVAPKRSDRHCAVELGYKSDEKTAHLRENYDWKPELNATLHQLHDALDGEAFRVFNQLAGPMAAQRKVWEKESLAAAETK